MLFPTGSGGIPADISMTNEWAPTSQLAYQQHEHPPKRQFAPRDNMKIDDIVTYRRRPPIRDSQSLKTDDIPGAKPRMPGFRYNSLEGNIHDSPQMDYYKNFSMGPPQMHSR